MGQSESKKSRIPKEERLQRENIKQNALKQQIQKIEDVQEKMWSNTKENSTVSYNEFNQFMKIGDIAKTQLSKGGNPLTKSDLIAILIRLEPSNKNRLTELQQYTISDLNTMIRYIIYSIPNLNSEFKMIKS